MGSEEDGRMPAKLLGVPDAVDDNVLQRGVHQCGVVQAWPQRGLPEVGPGLIHGDEDGDIAGGAVLLQGARVLYHVRAELLHLRCRRQNGREIGGVGWLVRVGRRRGRGG